MDELSFNLHKIKQNVTRLLALLRQLRQEKKRLAEENLQLQIALSEERKKVEELENKNLNLQLTKSFENGKTDNAGLKQRLDELIREIDDCIAHLKG